MMRECIDTLLSHTTCEIIFHTDRDRDLPGVSHFYPLDQRWYGRRMTRKLELASDLPAVDGDCVLVLDTDLSFNSDPFSVFENDFDVFYTTRHFVCNFKVNAGVWGFRANDRSAALLQFLANEANQPTWEPYLRWRSIYGRDQDERDKDWWTNQDLLCVLHENPPPLTACLYDAGWKYNLCPMSGGGVWLDGASVQDFISRSPEAIVVHYKELKRVVPYL